MIGPKDVHMMRAVALGIFPGREHSQPPWVWEAFQRTASDAMVDLYETNPLSWGQIVKTLRRARLLSASVSKPTAQWGAIEKYEKVEEGDAKDVERLLKLVEKVQVQTKNRIIANWQKTAPPDNRTKLVRAYGDLMWVSDWLHRRELGVIE